MRDDFPPETDPRGQGVFWPVVAAAALLGSWALTLLSAALESSRQRPGFYLGLVLAIFLSAAGAAALLAGPWRTGLDPASHVYGATVWILVIWAAVQALLGIIMQLYCMARRLAGRMTARYDMDITTWRSTGISPR